jgi:hypothetical protein
VSYSGFTRLLFRISPKRTLHGIPTAVLLISSDQERVTLFEKIDAALTLLQRHAPVRFQQVTRDMGSIFVCGDPSTHAHYNPDLRMCELSFFAVVRDGYAAAELASSIVHEAQHGRLLRLGFGYDARLRGRIERLCYRAERAFGGRLPDGAEIVERASAGMALDASHFTAVARSEAQAAAFERLEGPRWLMRLFASSLRRRAQRAQRAADADRPTTKWI